MAHVVFNFGKVTQKLMSSEYYYTRNYREVLKNMFIDSEITIGQSQEEYDKTQREIFDGDN